MQVGEFVKRKKGTKGIRQACAICRLANYRVKETIWSPVKRSIEDYRNESSPPRRIVRPPMQLPEDRENRSNTS